jgi:ABC-type dipeptide/oligopeptide/nickel transport system permease subunit
MAKGMEGLEKTVAALEFSEAPPKYREFRRVMGVIFRRKLSLIGFIIIVAFILTAIFAHWLAPYDPYEMDLTHQLQRPSMEHLLGTDALGRDTLSRIIYGAQTSLVVGLGAVGLGVLIGQSLGLIAAYFEGVAFVIIMRFIDALMAVPGMLIALVLAAILGGGLKNIIVALGVAVVSGHCRLMCAQALTTKQNDYILAARTMGASDLRMMLRHILPNAFPPLLVLMTMDLGVVIIAEAGLSFLGIGIAAPGAAWGSMVSDGYKYLLTHPVLSFAPGLACMLVVFGFNMAGDGLRDALDPRLRGAFDESRKRL